MGKITRDIYEVSNSSSQSRPDFIAIEEPLEIILKYPENGKQSRLNLSITMRTPGHDEELVMGFLFAEGIISQREEILDIKSIGPMLNTIEITIQNSQGVDTLKLARLTLTNSSCGVCGKSSIDFIGERGVFIHRPSLPSFRSDIFYQVLTAISEKQTNFQATGGVHAAAVFDPKGNIIVAREDVGRHNAMDKVIGYALENDLLPLKNCGILFSGRTSFELVQKAHMAGLPLTASVGAPSSLAVELAEETGMTLIGFLRKEKFNLYTDQDRVSVAI